MGGIGDLAAAVLIAQVVVVLALQLDPGRLAVAPGIVRAGGAGQLRRPLPLFGVALELDRIRGGAPDGLEVRLRLGLAPALLDQLLAALPAGLARARALRQALAAGAVRGRRIGGEGLIARIAAGEEGAGQDGSDDRQTPGHAHALVHFAKTWAPGPRRPPPRSDRLCSGCRGVSTRSLRFPLTGASKPLERTRSPGQRYPCPQRAEQQGYLNQGFRSIRAAIVIHSADQRAQRGSSEEPRMAKPEKRYRHRTIGEHELRPETLMMSYGYEPRLSEGSVKCPLFQTSTFVFERAEDGKAFFELAYGLREKRRAEEPGLIYSRINNPDLEILEDRLGLWDGAESTLVFSSGMAAISTTLWTFLRPGDVIVHSEPLYGGTEFLVHNILPQFGIRPEGFGTGGAGRALEMAIEAAKQHGRIAVIYVETPANPTNGLVDIGRCGVFAEQLEGEQNHRPPVIVDNTFLGPLWQQPLALGADLVIYSLTKYVGGHSDVIAGASLGSEALISGVRGMRTILGTMSDPHTGWLLMRSLETLKLRMTGAMKNAR